MSIGVWAKQGVVLPTSSDFCAQPNVLYEAGAVILTPNGDGGIFKMWFDNDNNATNTTNGVCYAESNDGLTWTRYAVTVPLFSPTPSTGNSYSRLFKNAGTYYIFTGPLVGPIQVWTSANGISWTRQNAAAISVGVPGAWDAIHVNLMNVAGQVGSTWYGYYAGDKVGSNGIYAYGLATSTDLINWTKGPSNPVITFDKPANFFWNYGQQINGTTYGWTIIQLPNTGSLDTQLPSDIMRFSGPSPAGPFTPLGTTTYYRTTNVDGVNGQNGQVADPCIISHSGNLYLYNTVQATIGGGPGGIEAAIASGMTFSQLIQTYEGVVNIPIPQSTLQLAAGASDTFARANANPIGGNWTAYSTIAGATSFAPGQIVSNQVEGTVIGNNFDSFYTGITWNADQWSQVTAQVSLANSAGIGVLLRANALGAYRLYWQGNLGSAGQYHIQKYTVAGNVFSNLLTQNLGFLTVNVGDVLMGCVVGTTLSIYLNTNLVCQTTDSTWASGSAGIAGAPTTALTNVAINNWSGGSIINAPPINPPAANVYSVPDCRVAPFGPNASRLVQGTKIFDVQTSSNPAIAPTDSRASKPVDSRVSANIPQNSRTPGTFGPGE